ncbi:NGG1p interacting factor NIF3, partial [bacterium]|nr:NGG1p interacting factor NIF3 [bacterium]
LVGIDIKCGEILLAHHLRKKGTKVDLVLAHHPVGLAISKLYDVMNMQKDILFDLGVPINISQGITEEKIGEIERLIMPLNVNRDIDMAEILDIPYMCVHTPADNMVAEYLQDIFDKEKPETLSDITDILHEIPEFRYSTRKHMPPQLFVGNKKSKCGKVVVDMTGGTEGSDKAFRYLAHAGVGTIVGMHVSEKFRLAAKENYINVVIAGHIASDTLGMNLFLDEVLKKVELDIIECSGFYRVDRRGKIKKASMMSKKLKQKDLDGKYFK